MNTNLTPIPAHIQVQQLPYKGSHVRKAAKFRRYTVHAKVDGVLPKFGPGYTTLEAALRKAASLSVEHGNACIMDNALATGQRMIRLFRQGVDYFAGAPE